LLQPAVLGFLRLDPGATCDSILDRAEEKIREVEERIQTLQQMKKALKALAKACPGKGPITRCPILGVTDDYYEVVHEPARRQVSRRSNSRREKRTPHSKP
jgi:hypothetical protein